ncbi:response regulator transcription factor [Streptomyces shenzhenensis]|uniref:response regulator transcription factor n=1 Tax=Streptomyces shenzhenensis TaxID=943815 RepID=UPI0036CEEF7D
MTPTVTILSDDQLTREGAEAYLRSCAQVEVLEPQNAARASVAVVLSGRVTETTLASMEAAARNSTHPDLRIVLVAEAVSDLQLVRAVNCGLTSVLLRPHTGYKQLLRAIEDTAAGGAVLPKDLTSTLIRQIRVAQRAASGRGGASAFSMSPRELDILRMLSYGLETSEIARELNYSERTIKNVLHAMLSRLGLHNRAHAVAHAIRAGLL